MPKLSTKYVNSITPSDKDIIVRDNEIKGFICKITPKGKRVYMLYYRNKDFRERKPVIGYQGKMTCDQARDIAKDWQARITKGEDPSLDKANLRKMITVNGLFKKYMKEYAPRKKPYGMNQDKRMWELHILPRIGNHKVSAVTKEDIIKIHTAMTSSPIIANRCRSLLSKAFNLAEAWGYRMEGTNPCRYVKKYAENKRDRYLSPEEITRLNNVLDACQADKSVTPSAIAAIRLLMLTGCRLSEILMLEWQYVDLKNHVLNLPDSKTGAKTIILPPSAKEILQFMHDDEERDKANPYVIWGKEKGSRLINLQKSWVRVKNKAKISDVRMHDLRHTFASIAVSNGLGLPIIGKLLGHKSVQTTARYAHLAHAPLKEAAALIGGKISEAMKGGT